MVLMHFQLILYKLKLYGIYKNFFNCIKNEIKDYKKDFINHIRYINKIHSATQGIIYMMYDLI